MDGGVRRGTGVCLKGRLVYGVILTAVDRRRESPLSRCEGGRNGPAVPLRSERTLNTSIYWRH